MGNLKRLLVVLLVLVLVLTTLFFVLENQRQVALMLFGWSLPEAPLAVVVLLAFGAGLCVGPLLALLITFRMRRQASPA